MAEKEIFAIDIGNSRTHTGIVDNTSVSSYRVLENESVNELDINKIDVDLVISSVNSIAEKKVIDLCKSKNIQPKLLDIESQRIITNTYEGLGMDRICDLAAGISLSKKQNILIANFGTATTISTCNIKGEFTGGIIKAGIKTELDYLVKNTNKLPDISPEDLNSFDLNTLSTQSAMAGGVLLSQVGAVEKYLSLYKEKNERPYIILTGGLAQLISKHFNNYNLLEEKLSLIGIYEIYKKCLVNQA